MLKVYDMEIDELDSLRSHLKESHTVCIRRTERYCLFEFRDRSFLFKAEGCAALGFCEDEAPEFEKEYEESSDEFLPVRSVGDQPPPACIQ